MNCSLSQLWPICLAIAVAASGCAAPPWAAKPNSPPGAGANAASPGKNPLAVARLDERRGQLAEAERVYLDVARQSPNNPVPYHRLAVIYAKQGKVKDAEANFTRALALKPDDPQLLSDLGYFYHLSSRPQEAEQCLRRAVEIEPANAAYCNNLALVIGEQGRREECLALFRRAGSEPNAYANYAFVLAQQGAYQESLDLYDRLLTRDPSMRVAADAMIALSRYAPRRPPIRPAAPPVEGRPPIAVTQYAPDQEASATMPAADRQDVRPPADRRDAYPTADRRDAYPTADRMAQASVSSLPPVPAPMPHVSGRAPIRPAAPPVEDRPRITATQYDPGEEASATVLAADRQDARPTADRQDARPTADRQDARPTADRQDAYPTADRTAQVPVYSLPPVPPPMPQPRAMAALPRYAPAPPPANAAEHLRPRESLASTGPAPSGTASPIPPAPVAGGSEPPLDSSPSPWVAIAERVALVVVAGVIFWGIGRSRLPGRKRTPTALGGGGGPVAGGGSHRRPKRAMAATSHRILLRPHGRR